MSENALHLLAQARLLKDKHDALAAATGENFNLFEILGRERDEVRTHSALLAELLNPHGLHRQGAAFARHFVDRFVKPLGLPDVSFDTALVRREAAIDGESRADILIETDDACIVIENKIDAPDQPSQLKRYHDFAAGQRTHSKVFYLTVHGDDPSDQSLAGLPREAIECISYGSDVLAWLDDCIREVARVPHIREILAHYQGLLRKLAGKSTGELTMELKELLASRHGDGYNFELAPRIADAMTALSVEKESAFWETMKKQLLDPGERPWHLSRAPPIGVDSNPLKEATESVVRDAHVKRQKRWFYGWTFRMHSSTEPDRYRPAADTEILLRVECDGSG